MPKSYPIYDSSFREQLLTVREFVGRLENIQTIGRNGLHRYDNQDHAMLTGIWAARNIMFGEGHNVWNVNTEQEYLEQIRTDIYEEEPIGEEVVVSPAGLNGVEQAAPVMAGRLGALE